MSKSGKVGKYEVEDGVVDGTAGTDLIFPHFVDVDGDTVDGADGLDDIIYGYAGNDNIQGGAGNDVIYGDSDASREIPAAGKAGKAGKYDDLVDGNDTLNGGAGSDIIYGGGGDDLILVDGIGAGYDDFVDGGTFETTLVASGKAGKAGEPTDNDTLNITGSTDGETVFARLDNLRPDSDGNGQDGTVTWLDADGNVLGSMDFENIEYIVGDFTPPPENNDPEAENDTAFVDEDGEVTINVLGNDTDPDGDDLTVTDATSPDGEVTINADGTITFTPNENFNGTTTITYTVDDGNGGTDTATVDVTVNAVDELEAVDDTAETDEDTPVTIDVVANDLNVDGGEPTIISATVPADQGTVEIVGNELVFTPAENFNGDATITYTIEDEDGLQDTAEVAVTVTPVNDAPDAVNDEDVTAFNTPVTVDLLANDTDVDGDDLSVLIATVPADQGTLVDNGDGTVTFTPALGFVGAATISYTIKDEEGLTDSAVHVITVAAGELDGTVEGTAGDDLIDGDYLGDPDGDMVDNNDAILPGDVGDDDLIYGFGCDDSILAGAGDDEVYGGDGNDTIVAAAGDDTVYGGDGDDSLEGGSGDDTIIGGTGEDEQYGGLGNDTFLGGNGGDVVVGGEDPDLDGDGESDDVDVLDLTGSGVANIDYVAGDPEAGTVTFLDGSTMTFSEIENVIPCFTPGTTIATPKGERLVEELREGDRIITRDNGIQEIRWVGRKEMSGKSLVANPHLKPILIRAGSLGNGLPERDMLVSPNHRMLVASEKTQLYFEEHEVLAAAKHLVGSEGIHAVDVMGTAYIHFMFDRHEVVLSNGAWTESFQPGDYSLKGIGNSQRNEIFELFPELQEKQGLEGYQSARRALKKHEAKLLVR
jgi:Ca2+-binding RTX toxin-like protein